MIYVHPEVKVSKMLHSLFGSSDFVPRRLCGLWTEPLLTLHMTSDLIIWASYLCISVMLFHALRLWLKDRIDIEPARHQAPFLGLIFGAFILLCGGTHLNQVIVFYWPYYRFIGVWSSITALVSFIAVLTLWKSIKTVTKVQK